MAVNKLDSSKPYRLFASAVVLIPGLITTASGVTAGYQNHDIVPPGDNERANPPVEPRVNTDNYYNSNWP